LRLPADWNGRLLYQGGGGNDGTVRPAVGPQAAPGYALNRGFAVVTTDAGHQGPSAEFGFDMQARLDNAYAAHDRVAVTAKELVKRFYSKPADKSYFIGCSGGGRQAMMFTQRFPHHFDGVIAMAPAMRVSKGATIAAAWDTQALQAIAPKNAQGQGILSQALSNEDLALVRKGVLDACDAQDGVADGLVSNPSACKFDVKSLQCSAEKSASCLAAPQVSALQKIFTGAKNSRGDALYFTWPWDAGVGHVANDWRNWKLGTSTTPTANSRHVFLMQDALQGYFVTPPDRSLSIYQFNFDTDPARMDAHSWIFNTADDVKLTGYKSRGGKLLFAHGMADPIFSPDEMVDYYQRLSKEHGAATQDFSRLFLIPRRMCGMAWVHWSIGSRKAKRLSASPPAVAKSFPAARGLFALGRNTPATKALVIRKMRLTSHALRHEHIFRITHSTPTATQVLCGCGSASGCAN
jgi:pimeloyl-ACP methyl ester carboxylesterase